MACWPSMPCMQVNVSWPVAPSSCPGSPCWSRAACSSAPPTCPTPAPTPAWPVTPGASMRRPLTCWCGVSDTHKKHKELIKTSLSSCNVLQNHHFTPQADRNPKANRFERKNKQQKKRIRLEKIILFFLSLIHSLLKVVGNDCQDILTVFFFFIYFFFSVTHTSTLFPCMNSH